MTIAREGLREILAATVFVGGAAVAAGWASLTVSPLFWPLAAICLALWVFTVAFFREPARPIPKGAALLVSPADGRITEISRLNSLEGIEGPAVRIGIFLSVFDVHVNVSPCTGRVVSTNYAPGRFLDARHPESGVLNESNSVVIDPEDMPGPVIVRQVAGLIARRIVCHLRAGDRVERGRRFGIIKFGSRAELIIPVDSGLEPVVAVGEHVRGGATILMAQAAEAKPARAGEPRAQLVTRPG
jgi:phosphatidylserine decarboxylase